MRSIAPGAAERAASLSALPLAATLIAIAALRPPEFNPDGKILFLVLAAGAALLAGLWPAAESVPGSGRASEIGAARAWLWLLPLVLFSVAAAPCRSRAVDELAMLSALLLVGMLGARIARQERALRFVPAVFVGLACVASLQAIVQAHWLYPRQATLLRGSAEDNLVLRLLAGRPSGPFILPAALAGFLALALPLALVLRRHAASRGARLLLLAAILLELYALVLTRSLGGAMAAAFGVALVLPALTPRRRGIWAALVALVAVLTLGAFLHVRRAELASGSGGDPLRLRAGNWSAAARMIADQPLFGVGPGSFGVAYTRYMKDGMNETRFAHNSYLQLAACWGGFVAVPLLALLARFARNLGARRAACAPGPAAADLSLAVSAAAAAFALHNLVDFTLYLPGVAASGALLFGMSLAARKESAAWPGGAAEHVHGPRVAPLRGARTLVAAAAALCLARHAIVAGREELLLERARLAAEAGDIDGAARHARQAAAVRPGSSDAWAFLSQLTLAHRMQDDVLRRAGAEAAERAARLDPDSAILHHTLAAYHAAAGETSLAFLEERRAHDLYPRKPLYQPPNVARAAP